MIVFETTLLALLVANICLYAYVLIRYDQNVYLSIGREFNHWRNEATDLVYSVGGFWDSVSDAAQELWANAEEAWETMRGIRLRSPVVMEEEETSYQPMATRVTVTTQAVARPDLEVPNLEDIFEAQAPALPEANDN